MTVQGRRKGLLSGTHLLEGHIVKRAAASSVEEARRNRYKYVGTRFPILQKILKMSNFFLDYSQTSSLPSAVSLYDTLLLILLEKKTQLMH